MFDPTIGDTSLLNRVREGMEVRDSGGEKVGTIKRVQMGGNDPVDGARQANEAGPTDSDRAAGDLSVPPVGANDLGVPPVGALVSAFGGNDDLPEEARQELTLKGFIEIGGGLFRASRYATGDQIASVTGDDVALNVAADMLIKG